MTPNTGLRRPRQRPTKAMTAGPSWPSEAATAAPPRKAFLVSRHRWLATTLTRICHITIAAVCEVCSMFVVLHKARLGPRRPQGRNSAVRGRSGGSGGTEVPPGRQPTSWKFFVSLMSRHVRTLYSACRTGVLGSLPLASVEFVLVAGSAPPLVGAAGSAPPPVDGPSLKTPCLLCTQEIQQIRRHSCASPIQHHYRCAGPGQVSLS